LLRRFVLNPLEAAIAYLLFFFFRLWRPETASCIGGAICRAIGPLLPISQRAHRNLRIAFPDMSEAERNTVVADMWENLGRVAAELPHMRQLSEGDYSEVVGAEHLRSGDSSKPLICWTGHLGNWEMIPAVLERYGIEMDFVYRAPNNPLVDDLLRKIRAKAARGGLIPKGARGARDLVKTLSEKGSIGLVIDQKMNDGIAVPFFGRDAMTAPALASLALRYECPAVPIRVERLGGARFRITIYPPLDITLGGNHHAGVREIMAQVNAMVEGWIREQPAQWLWLHNRWPS
jgi:KDO2-lipid IV(A) lauroyltransferase